MCGRSFIVLMVAVALSMMTTSASPIQDLFDQHRDDNGTSVHHRQPKEHALRLLGVGKKEGLLQIFHEGQWGTICDDNWDMRDAHVACRQLGFGEAQDPLLRSYDGDTYSYEQARQYTYPTFAQTLTQHRSPDIPIWMDNVRCLGTEARLVDCAFAGWGLANCGHYEDVAIRCKGMELARTITFSVTFFCVSTTISIVAIGIAFFTLMRVWSITRGPLFHPIHQVMPQPATDATVMQVESPLSTSTMKSSSSKKVTIDTENLL